MEVGLTELVVPSMDEGVVKEPGIWIVLDALGRRLKDALTQRRFWHPKGKLVEEVDEDVPEAGVAETETLRQARSVHLLVVTPGFVVAEEDIEDGTAEDRTDVRGGSEMEENGRELLPDVGRPKVVSGDNWEVDELDASLSRSYRMKRSGEPQACSLALEQGVRH